MVWIQIADRPSPPRIRAGTEGCIPLTDLLAMAWRIEVSDSAAKQLRKLGPQIARRIPSFLRDRLAPLDDPRSLGEALRGKEPGDFWKYRVGDWRIITDLADGMMLITMIRLGNRREVYRR